MKAKLLRVVERFLRPILANHSAEVKADLARSIQVLSEQVTLLSERVAKENAEQTAKLQAVHRTDQWTRRHLIRLMLAAAARGAGDEVSVHVLETATSVALSVRGNTLTIAAGSLAAPPLASDTPQAVLDFLEADETWDQTVSLISDLCAEARALPWAMSVLKHAPKLAQAFGETYVSSAAGPRSHLRDLHVLCDTPELTPFVAAALEPVPPPFYAADLYKARPAARPKRRSAVFLHNNYYHYNCLSDALRKRGWDTATVSIQPADSPQRLLFHGEDVNLYDPDPQVMRDKTTRFFATVPERFGNLHFYGRGCASFFPELSQSLTDSDPLPFDFLELRRHGVLIGTMPSGCLEGAAQSSINVQAQGVCDRCVWQLHPNVCNDRVNLEWNNRLIQLCDWIGLECDHQTPERVGPKFITDPVVTCLDPDRWHPDLEIPEDMRLARHDETVMIYHAVGNYETRRAKGRDIKGTGAVFEAIETLKAEGFPVELIFVHDVPSTKVLYLQVQADIVVDQLNYGRYGANARESLMLGRPTITKLIADQASGMPQQRAVRASPLVNADEQTLTDVLRELVRDKDKRREIGVESREFALQWHAQDICAERFEKLTDAIAAGTSPSDVDLWPAPT
tara:strand:- start:461 stop:2335 length:1875 start_codon:yes stop_codon:yes gene_type:complete